MDICKDMLGQVLLHPFWPFSVFVRSLLVNTTSARVTCFGNTAGFPIPILNPNWGEGRKRENSCNRSDYNKTFIRNDQGGKNVKNPLFPCSTHIHTHAALILEVGDEYSLGY